MAAKKTPRLVLFNHKGGVGKTTLTVNIAYALAAAGKRVLLVDTDPQCSLSSFFLTETYLDKLLDESENPGGNTLWTALQPVSEGTGSLVDITPIKIQERIFLAVGDIRLSEFENSLADCWRLCADRNRRGYICTAALSKLVDKLVKETQADFVFFDSGPNIGPLNRIVLLDCSHFIIPAACDLFSSRALKTLGFALSQWIRTWARNKEQAPDGIAVLNGHPRLLGFIPQGFRIYRGEMASAPFSLLAKLNQRVIDFVWRPLQEASETLSKEKPIKLKLGQVRFFGDLATRSQTEGVPIWKVSSGNAASKGEAKAIFKEIAAAICSLTAE